MSCRCYFFEYPISLSLTPFRPDPFIFSPFSTGHRSCIGKVFAIVSEIYTFILDTTLIRPIQLDSEE